MIPRLHVSNTSLRVIGSSCYNGSYSPWKVTTGSMPLYEYRCGECHGVTSVLSYSWKNSSEPTCRRCGGDKLTKLISGFSFHRSWGDSLNWAPSGETLTDVDEDSPQDLDRFMGRLKEEMGGEVTTDFNQMRKELTSDS